jgi:hypothetical protein
MLSGEDNHRGCGDAGASVAAVAVGEWASGAAALEQSSRVASLPDFGVSRGPSRSPHPPTAATMVADQFDFGAIGPLLVSVSGAPPTPRRAGSAFSGSTARSLAIFSQACHPHHGCRERIRGKRAARRGRRAIPSASEQRRMPQIPLGITPQHTTEARAPTFNSNGYWRVMRGVATRAGHPDVRTFKIATKVTPCP